MRLKDITKKKSIIKRIVKERRRNRDFKHMIKYVGRGEINGLRILYIKDLNQMQMLYKRQ